MANFGSFPMRSLSRSTPSPLPLPLKGGEDKGEGVFQKVFSLVCVLFFFIVQTGCTVWRNIPFKSYEVSPVPDELLRYYDYEKKPLEAVVIKEKEEKKYIFRQVELPLYLPKEIEIKPANEWREEIAKIRTTNEKGANELSLHYTNRLDLYLPKRRGQRPLILISPITGGNMVVDLFAKYYAAHGYVAVIVHRKKPFYDENLGPEQVENYLRASIIRLRQALDWLETQPEVDPQRIGGFGISYGAVLHSILAAIEPRIQYHVLAMPGAPLPEIILYCPDPGIKKLVIGMEKMGWSREKIYSELKRTIRTDPIFFARYIRKDRVVIFWALFDRVVGAGRTFQLWEAMDRPKLKVIPLGHYGGILVLPYLQFSSLRFFNARL